MSACDWMVYVSVRVNRVIINVMRSLSPPLPPGVNVSSRISLCAVNATSPAKPHQCPVSVGTFLLKKLFHLMSSVDTAPLFFHVLTERPSHKIATCCALLTLPFCHYMTRINVAIPCFFSKMNGFGFCQLARCHTVGSTSRGPRSDLSCSYVRFSLYKFSHNIVILSKTMFAVRCPRFTSQRLQTSRSNKSEFSFPLLCTSPISLLICIGNAR